LEAIFVQNFNPLLLINYRINQLFFGFFFICKRFCTAGNELGAYIQY